MKKMIAMMIVMAMAAVTNAASYGWEDRVVGDTDGVLGTYGNIGSATVSDEYAYEGSNSIKITEDPISGTPQVYLAWVTGLAAGDTVTASVWMISDSISSGGRLWGHWTPADDMTGYSGSASGPDEYALGSGAVWTYQEHTWTLADDDTALMIEGRVYTNNNENVIYYDALEVTSSNPNAMIEIPAVPEPATMALVGAGALGLIRRRK